VSLVVKDSKVVAVAFCQAQAVNVDGCRLCAMDTSQIDHKLAVDVHPHVIVSSELKDLPSAVLKDAHKHHGKCKIFVPVVVVVVHVVTETGIVDGEEVGEISLVNPVTAGGLCCVAPGVQLGQCNVSWNVNGVACSCSIGPQIMVKAVECVCVGHGGVLRRNVEGRQTVRGQDVVDQTSITSIIVLKIGVASVL